MEEVKVGKVVAKFVIKFILWFILFFVIGAIIAGVSSGTTIARLADGDMNRIADFEEMFAAIDGFIYGMIVVELIAAFLATVLSIRGVTKKVKITSENRPKIAKKIAIVFIVIAILVIIIHGIIFHVIDSLMVKDTDDFSGLHELVKEAEEKRDEIADVFDITGIDDEDIFEDAVDLLKGFVSAGRTFEFSGIVYIIMIPIEYILLKKKEE